MFLFSREKHYTLAQFSIGRQRPMRLHLCRPYVSCIAQLLLNFWTLDKDVYANFCTIYQSDKLCKSNSHSQKPKRKAASSLSWVDGHIACRLWGPYIFLSVHSFFLPSTTQSRRKSSNRFSGLPLNYRSVISVQVNSFCRVRYQHNVQYRTQDV